LGPIRAQHVFDALRARADTNSRFPAEKEAVSRSRSEQDIRASGFSWVAREPKLICGAKGARILTEINRLTQLASPPNDENEAKFSPLVTATTCFRDPNPGGHHSAQLFLSI